MTLNISELQKRFGSTSALANFTLELQTGEFVAVVGPSGCGKTTLLRLIAGLETPDAGSISIQGRDITRLRPRQRDVAMVFQGESLYPHMTVFENMAFPLKMRKVADSEIQSRVETMAAQVQVAEFMDRRPGTLSGGQRQRVALGRALVRAPAVFLLDEPFSHLDPHLRRQLRTEIMELRKSWSATTLFVTHDQREAMLLGDRVAVMHEGKLLQLGTPEEIKNAPSNDFVAEFLADEYAA